MRETADVDNLVRALARQARPTVRLGHRAAATSDVDLERLHPVEASVIRRATPSRRREFAAGRVLLRDLIGRDVPIPVGPDRAPVVPTGVVASLSHDEGVVVAAIASDPSVVALGIDVGRVQDLESGVAEVVLRADEPDLRADLAFVLKEAAYKAWSSLGGRVLEHHDVRARCSAGSFTAEVVDDGTVLHGRYARGADLWLALVVVHATAPIDVGPE